MKTTIAVGQVVVPLLMGYRRATKFLAPNLVVKGTRQHRLQANTRSSTIVLTIGTPNYAERRFIKVAKRAKMRFPIRKVQVQTYKAGA